MTNTTEIQLNRMTSLSVDHAYEGREAARHDVFADEAYPFDEAVRLAEQAAFNGLDSDAAFFAGYALEVGDR